MTMSGLAANRRPRMVAPRSPGIIYSGFYKGGRGARSDSKAADWNYGRWMFDLAVWDPGCHTFKVQYPTLQDSAPISWFQHKRSWLALINPGWP